jgi:signal transduction histidine kinase
MKSGVRLRKSYLLAAAFATLVLVIAITGLAAWQKGTLLMHHVTEVHSTHKRAGDALQRIRENGYLVSILIRDYLLDPDAAHTQVYIDQFQGIQAETQEAFKVLQKMGLDNAQRKALEELRGGLLLHWDPTEIALDLTPEEKAARRTQLLRQRVRRREEIFQLAAQVQHLLDENLKREQAGIAKAEEGFAMFLWWSTLAGSILAVGIAAVTLIRLLRFERESEASASELRRLSKQLRTAQEEERKSLARELHDQVGQMLTGLRMEVSTVAGREGLPEADAHRLQHAKSTVEHLLRTVRNIAMLLRPSMLDDLGLAPAINWQVKEFSRVSGTPIDAQVDPELDLLPDEYRTCLYRIVQEALTNCGRHAQAGRCVVQIKRAPKSVVATISDNGIGFAPEIIRGRGLGLLGIEERVRELGGELTISAEPGHGTQLKARIPLPGDWVKEHDKDTGRGRPRHHQDRTETPA